ncbi:MAG: hypothetical protein GTO03_15230, partial [Planctomycetales bacterium]|nr:hypothetical protein [Planctomycetales bacterium]
MSRIFASLSICAILLMATSVVLGLRLEKNALVQQVRAAEQRIASLAGSPDRGAGEVQEAEQDLEAAIQRLRAEQAYGTAHLLTGVAATLGIVLVGSIAVTYFIGTGRWCREVVEAYALEDQLLRASRDLKGRSFPWALAAMLTAVGVSALGARSDPATGFANSAAWVTVHLAAALGGLVLVCVCF